MSNDFTKDVPMAKKRTNEDIVAFLIWRVRHIVGCDNRKKAN